MSPSHTLLQKRASLQDLHVKHPCEEQIDTSSSSQPARPQVPRIVVIDVSPRDEREPSAAESRQLARLPRRSSSRSVNPLWFLQSFQADCPIQSRGVAWGKKKSG